LIEDDAETQAYVASGLTQEGHRVRETVDGRDGLFIASTEDFDLLIVDRMLPSMDGLSLVKALRASNIETPILFLTTMSGISDRVTGLNAGGDDYLIKPFAFAELSARVAALGRRPRGMAVEKARLRIADLELDLLSRAVRRGGREISLQPREFRLRVFDASRWPGRDPHHVARQCLGLPFRPENQCRRVTPQPSPNESRQGLFRGTDSHRPRLGILHPCA
jgi:two-component system OmpR family response regulator